MRDNQEPVTISNTFWVKCKRNLFELFTVTRILLPWIVSQTTDFLRINTLTISHSATANNRNTVANGNRRVYIWVTTDSGPQQPGSRSRFFFLSSELKNYEIWNMNMTRADTPFCGAIWIMHVVRKTIKRVRKIFYALNYSVCAENIRCITAVHGVTAVPEKMTYSLNCRTAT